MSATAFSRMLVNHAIATVCLCLSPSHRHTYCLTPPVPSAQRVAGLWEPGRSAAADAGAAERGLRGRRLVDPGRATHPAGAQPPQLHPLDRGPAAPVLAARCGGAVRQPSMLTRVEYVVCCATLTFTLGKGHGIDLLTPTRNLSHRAASQSCTHQRPTNGHVSGGHGLS